MRKIKHVYLILKSSGLLFKTSSLKIIDNISYSPVGWIRKLSILDRTVKEKKKSLLHKPTTALGIFSIIRI